MTQTVRIKVLVVAAIAFPLGAWAQGADLGRNLAATCANCHNTTGKSVGNTPSIAGLSREAMFNMLKEFKEGRRPATVMHQHARGYTDAQLELIAAHYAAQNK